MAPSSINIIMNANDGGTSVDSHGVWFGLMSGGVLCPACCEKDLNAIKMSQKALLLLREYKSRSLRELREAFSSDAVSREAADVLNSFLRAQIGEGAKLKSLDFLERMRDASYAR